MSTRRRWRSYEGQGLLEYSLLLSLIVMVVFASVVLLGPQVSSLLTAVTNAFPAS